MVGLRETISLKSDSQESNQKEVRLEQKPPKTVFKKKTVIFLLTKPSTLMITFQPRSSEV